MEGGFAAGGGVFLEEAFFDGLIKFGLGMTEGCLTGFRLKRFGGELDEFFGLFVLFGAFDGSPRGFFGGFYDWHL